MGEEYTRVSLIMYASALLPLMLSLAWLGFRMAMFGLGNRNLTGAPFLLN